VPSVAHLEVASTAIRIGFRPLAAPTDPSVSIQKKAAAQAAASLTTATI
jgi:hypothetical protein